MKGSFIPDNDLLLAEAQTVTSSAAGNVSAGYVDLGTDYAEWPSMVGVFEVGTTDFANADETYEYKVQFSNATNFATIEGEYSVTVSSQAELDPNNSTVLVPARATGRYARAYITVAGTTPSTVVSVASLNKE